MSRQDLFNEFAAKTNSGTPVINTMLDELTRLRAENETLNAALDAKIDVCIDGMKATIAQQAERIKELEGDLAAEKTLSEIARLLGKDGRLELAKQVTTDLANDLREVRKQLAAANASLASKDAIIEMAREAMRHPEHPTLAMRALAAIEAHKKGEVEHEKDSL